MLFPLSTPAVKLILYTIREIEILLLKVNALGEIRHHVISWQSVDDRWFQTLSKMAV